MNLPRPHLSLSKRIDPVSHWVLLVLFSFVLLGASVAWNLWLFERVASGEVIGKAPSLLPSVFDESSLEQISRIIVDRNKEQTKYENGTYHFVDPSK